MMIREGQGERLPRAVDRQQEFGNSSVTWPNYFVRFDYQSDGFVRF